MSHFPPFSQSHPFVHNGHMENLTELVTKLSQLPAETEWVEFKHNKYTPEMIGEDISALANGATLS